MARGMADSDDSDFAVKPQRGRPRKKETKAKKVVVADAKKRRRKDERDDERDDAPPKAAANKKTKLLLAKEPAPPPVVETDDPLDPALLEEKYRALKNVRLLCLCVCDGTYGRWCVTHPAAAAFWWMRHTIGAGDGRGAAAAPGARAGAGGAKDARGACLAAEEGDHGAVVQTGGGEAEQEEGQAGSAQRRRGVRPGSAGSVGTCACSRGK